MPLIYGEGWKRALDRLQRKIQKSLNLASLVSTDAPWIVPFERNPRFTSRGPQLAQLEEKLFAKDYTTKIAMMGLGGVGKTQLVLEVLFRTKEKHQNCAITWIPATNTESLHQACLDVAQRLGIQGWNEQNADVKALSAKISERRHCRPVAACVFMRCTASIAADVSPMAAACSSEDAAPTPPQRHKISLTPSQGSFVSNYFIGDDPSFSLEPALTEPDFEATPPRYPSRGLYRQMTILHGPANKLEVIHRRTAPPYNMAERLDYHIHEPARPRV